MVYYHSEINEKLFNLLKKNYDYYLNLLKNKQYDELLNELCAVCYPYLLKETSDLDYSYWDFILPYDNNVSQKYNVDFVNASFVNRFVCCQEPKQKYIDRFYNFLLNSDIKLIISLKENVVFFNEKEKYNIKFENEIFRVKEYNLNGKQIIQIHCYVWPDHGVLSNNQLDQLYSYIKNNYDYFFFKKYNTLVHCWAGVGRTGTFVMYSILTELNKEITYELFLDILLSLRSQRPLFVESSAQLKYLIDKFILKNIKE